MPDHKVPDYKVPDQVIRDLEALEAAIQQPRVLLLKHSPICPISSTARAEWEMFRLDCPDVPMLLVDVINARTVAHEIANKSGVKHESPQALLFENGEVKWHASHSAITVASLTAAWAPSC